MKLQVGVKALISNTRGELLFVKRTDKLPDGSGIRWDVPGGRIDPSETLTEALGREILEETAMQLKASPQLIDAQDILIPDISLHVVRLTYHVEAAGTLQLSSEHQEYTWLPIDKASQLNTDAYLRRTIQKLQTDLDA